MRFSKVFTAAAVAISMAGTPVLAQSAAPLSVTSSVSRAGAATKDENELGGITTTGIIVIILVVLSAILIPEITKPNSP
jgi:hypothetical protein